MMNNIITITKIRGLEWENHKLFLEKWSLNGFTRYCTLQMCYMSLENQNNPLDPIKILLSKMRSQFDPNYTLEDWEEFLKYVKNHYFIYASYIMNDIISSYKLEDVDHIKETDENYDIIPKLHEFVHLYKEEKDNE